MGKTTAIEKFVNENFKPVICINLEEVFGESFIDLIEHCKKPSISAQFYLVSGYFFLWKR